MTNQKPIWGVDLGGTKIEGVILKSSEEPEVLHRLRVPTEASEGYDHILSQIEKLINQLKKESGLLPAAIGFGTPGTLDPESQAMKNANTTAFNGNRLHDDLNEKLGVPVRLANDANCFALAETRMGAVPQHVPGAKVVFGVIMGTGTGGGVVVNGEIIGGRHGIGGEWGHNFLDESGGKCYCGKTGCVEKIIAGPALEGFYKQVSGQTKKLPDIYEAHLNATDEYATQTIERLLHFFGLAISNVINILDPDAIVIGGGVGNIDLLYSLGVEEASKYAFNDKLETKFLKPLLGDSAGVFGAAYLVA